MIVLIILIVQMIQKHLLIYNWYRQVPGTKKIGETLILEMVEKYGKLKIMYIMEVHINLVLVGISLRNYGMV